VGTGANNGTDTGAEVGVSAGAVVGANDKTKQVTMAVKVIRL
jgi:hypothetical protein